MTDAYLKATDQYSSGALGMMDDYAQKDIGYAKGLHSNMEYLLQDLNDDDNSSKEPSILSISSDVTILIIPICMAL